MSPKFIWEIISVLCKALRWLTRRRPKRGTLLIVEDDPLDADILQRRLTRLGWESEIATSAEVALGLVKHNFFSAIFVDLRLPGMPGAALVRVLSKEAPNTHIIVVCGEPGDLLKLAPGQAVIFIRKPPELESIEDTLKKLRI